MLSIDNYAYCSRLRPIHPGEKLCLAVITLIICLAVNSVFLSITVLCFMVGITVGQGGVPWTVFLRLLLLPAGFLMIGVLTVALNIVPDSVPVLWGVTMAGRTLGITATGLAAAARLFFRALGSASCLYFLALTTPMLDIIAVLRRCKISPLFLELLSLTYRFIFVLLETSQRIATAQSARLGYANLTNSHRSLVKLIATLFANSYLYARNLYTALEARGYEGQIKVLEPRYPISKRNIILISSLEIGFILIALQTGGRF